MAIRIPLTRGATAIIDDADLGLVAGRRWHLSGGPRPDEPHGRWYALRGQRIAMHRLILNAGPGQQVDHINGDGLDNRRCNLRFATPSEQGRNRHAVVSRSGFKGVTWRSGKWQASIKVDDRRVYLGLHDTAEAAARAYDAAALAYFGDHAAVNLTPVCGVVAAGEVIDVVPRAPRRPPHRARKGTPRLPPDPTP